MLEVLLLFFALYTKDVNTYVFNSQNLKLMSSAIITDTTTFGEYAPKLLICG